MQSKAKQLEKHYGGRWRYDGRSSWWCDDGQRHVSRVACGCYTAIDGYPCNCPKRYVLYGDGVSRDIGFESDLVLELKL